MHHKHTHIWHLIWLPRNPSNEKVKLGWGWHPQIFTTTTIKCHLLGLQCVLPQTWSALWKAYLIKGLQETVKSHHVKGFQHPIRSVPD